MTATKKQRAKPLPPTTLNPDLLVDGSDQVLRRLTLAFAVLGWQLAEIRAKFGKLVHVSPFQYVVLQAIARVEASEPWTVASLAAHFNVTKAHVSMELRPLLAKALIQAVPNPADGRSRNLSLTDEGAKALVAMVPVQQKVNDLLYSQYDGKSLTRQCTTIERMAADAGKANEYLSSVLASRRFDG